MGDAWNREAERAAKRSESHLEAGNRVDKLGNHGRSVDLRGGKGCKESQSHLEAGNRVGKLGIEQRIEQGKSAR